MVLKKAESDLRYVRSLIDYFNRNQLYQEIIGLIDSNIPELIIEVLKFLKAYLGMGEIFKEENGLVENICSNRLYAMEFSLKKIECLTMHPDESICNLSSEICEQYLNKDYE